MLNGCRGVLTLPLSRTIFFILGIPSYTAFGILSSVEFRSFQRFDLSYSAENARIKYGVQNIRTVPANYFFRTIFDASKSKLSGVPNDFVRENPWLFSGRIRKLCYGENPRFTVATAHLRSIRSRAFFFFSKLPRKEDSRISGNSRITTEWVSGLDYVTKRRGYLLTKVTGCHGTDVRPRRMPRSSAVRQTAS